jgi:hypothetical protein
MSHTSLTYLVGACCGVFGLAAYVGWILVPAWNAYTDLWQRVAAGFLSLYVVAAFVAIGVVGGTAVTWLVEGGAFHIPGT